MLRVRAAVPVLLVAASLAVLAGCTPTSDEEPSTAPSASGTATTTPTDEPSPSATPSSTPTSVPIELGCDALVSAQTMYDFNPNYGLLDAWTPESGTAAADAVRDDGVACRWQNQTSGDTIDISAADLDPETLQALGNDAYASGTGVPTYGDEAYFSVEDGVGTAVVFQGSIWLVATSAAFLEPGDCVDVVNSALAALS